jgi:hypothetical protein
MKLPLQLRTFFDAFAPMLELTRGVGQVERDLGPSRSGPDRLGFYGVLARRTRFLALRDVCPAFRQAALDLDEPMWVEIVERYASRYPPTHPDPNRFGEGLADFVAVERGLGLKVPAYLEEIADYEYSLWAVGIDDLEPSALDIGFDRTIRVRHYVHDVASHVAEFHASGSPRPPVAQSCAVLIYRDLRTQLPRTFFPSALALIVLACRLGKPIAHDDLDEAALLAAERELIEHGVLLFRTAETPLLGDPTQAEPTRS